MLTKNSSINRYFKIFERTYNNMIDIGLKHHTKELEILYRKYGIKNYSINDKLEIIKELIPSQKFETIAILQGVKFRYLFKDIAQFEIVILKTGELKLLYWKQNSATNSTFSLYILEDFIKRYKTIENFCEFIYGKDLLPKTTLETIENVILNKFPNYSSPYGMPENKKYLQLKFKRLVLLNFMIDKENSLSDLKNIIAPYKFDNNWDEMLPSINGIENIIKEVLSTLKLTKKEIIEEHLIKLELFTTMSLNNVEVKKCVIYNTINSYFDILGAVKMLSPKCRLSIDNTICGN